MTMHAIKTKPFCLMLPSLLLMTIFSCNKNAGPNKGGIDTVRCEAIINYGSGNWCVAVTNPTIFGTDTSVIPTLVTSEYGQCYLTQNVEDTFLVQTYSNYYWYLKITANTS